MSETQPKNSETKKNKGRKKIILDEESENEDQTATKKGRKGTNKTVGNSNQKKVNIHLDWHEEVHLLQLVRDKDSYSEVYDCASVSDEFRDEIKRKLKGLEDGESWVNKRIGKLKKKFPLPKPEEGGKEMTEEEKKEKQQQDPVFIEKNKLNRKNTKKDQNYENWKKKEEAALDKMYGLIKDVVENEVLAEMNNKNNPEQAEAQIEKEKTNRAKIRSENLQAKAKPFEILSAVMKENNAEINKVGQSFVNLADVETKKIELQSMLFQEQIKESQLKQQYYAMKIENMKQEAKK